MTTYTKNDWKTGDAITADKLNNIENGIEAIVVGVNTVATAVADATAAVATLTESVTGINDNVSALSDQVSNINLENVTEALNNASASIQANSAYIADNATAIRAIKNRLDSLENVTSLLAEYSDTLVVDEIPAGITDFVSSKKLVITGADIDGAVAPIWNINGKIVVLDKCNANNVAINTVAEDEIIITGCNTTGILPKTVSNAMVHVNTNNDVIIKECDSAQNGYNCIEIGLNDTAPSKVVIKDCNFTGELANSAISIFATADNATIDIINCHFSKVSNVLRLSNRTNADNVIVRFVNCSWDQLDSNTEQKGVVICQDYTSESKAETIEANRFGNNKVAISFTDCVGENGTPVTLAEDGSSYVTGDNCLVYVYSNKWDNEEPGKVPYTDAPEMFPIVAV